MARSDLGASKTVNERLHREQIPGLAPQFAKLYHRSFESATHPPSAQDEAAFIPTLDLHAKREGFDLVGGREGDSGDLIGFVYGYRSAPGQYWNEKVTAPLPPKLRKRWFSHAFTSPSWR
ncbi:MAG: hypothetical protein WB778_09405 [Thermoplasmata archaeon]